MGWSMGKISGGEETKGHRRQDIEQHLPITEISQQSYYSRTKGNVRYNAKRNEEVCEESAGESIEVWHDPSRSVCTEER